MRTCLRIFAAAAFAAALLAPLVSEAQTQRAAQVGMLTCRLSPTIGLILGSSQTLDCQFVPNTGRPPETYTGVFNTVGVDIGITPASTMAWAVFAPTQGPPPGALAGDYIGATADVTVGLGIGANALIGGSQRSFALQPFSVEGSAGLAISVGAAGLQLRWVP